jgi:iron complex transport system permease protein
MNDTEQARKENLIREYGQTSARKLIFPITGAALLLALAALSVSWGAAAITAQEVLTVIVARVFPSVGLETGRLADAVVWNLRLPRVLMAIVAGAGFAVSGAAMQGILRNPLVSPFTIGISSGAGFGAALAIVMGIGVGTAGRYMVIGNAFFFAILAASLVYGLARARGATPETLILAGIALMYLFSAATSMLQYVATEHKLQEVVFWLFGSLGAVSWNDLGVIFLVFCACFPWMIKLAWDLNALSAGDDVAQSLGIHPPRVRLVIMLLSSLITATIICYTGIIGFVCLVAPHITRMVIGSDHRFLIPFSSIVGALLLLGADTAGRTLMAPAELPVGIVTSFIGVPLFIYLLITRKRQYFQ